MAVVNACGAPRVWLAAAALSLAACDPAAVAPPSVAAPPSATVQRAAGFDPGPVRTAAEYLAEPELAQADLARGELLGFACAACHQFRADEGTLIGPNLHGVFGRPAGAVAGFAYSPALAQSGLVWTPRALNAWLENPAGFVDGTTMAFTGYRAAADRRDLIAYLLHVTQ